MASSTGLASLLGAYNSDSDNEEDDNTENLTKTTVNNGEQQIQSTAWAICTDKITKTAYFWNIDTKAVTWDEPEELVNYLKYANEHKSTLLKSYGDKRWISHSNGSAAFYLDQLFRTVSWDAPPPTQEPHQNVEDVPREIKSKDNGMTSVMTKTTEDAPQTSSIECDRLASNYSPPPLFANVPTTVTVDEIEEAAATATGTRCVSECDRKLSMHAAGSVDGISGGRMHSDRNGNAADLVVATKRKRRIEIPRIAEKNRPPLKGQPQNTSEESVIVGKTMDTEIAGPDKMATGSQASYLNNFRAGGIEFIDEERMRQNVESEGMTAGDDVNALASNKRHCNGGPEGGGSPTTTKTVDSATDGGQLDDAQKNLDHGDIKRTADLVTGKMRFLSEGRPSVSGVQVMAIQLETLMAAYDASELGASYLKRWLRTTVEQLQQLEEEVAPDGWICKWDSETQRYFYENLATSIRQWEFPQPIPDMQSTNDDEMDISTTPPHESVSEIEIQQRQFGLDSVAQVVSIGSEITPTPPLPLQPPLPLESVESKPPLPPPPIAESVSLQKGIDSHGLSSESLTTSSGPPARNVQLGIGTTQGITASHEKPYASVAGGSTVDRLNFELDSFYSDIATIECNQETAEPETGVSSPVAATQSLPPPPSAILAKESTSQGKSGGDNSVDVSTRGKVTLGEKVSKKKKKVKTSLSDIKDMSHLISKWQKAQQDL